jgi:molybdopterin-containing oxidoreductase family membrane subunit
MLEGEALTGMRTVGAGGAVWGLYIVMDGYLLGAGVAVMVAACLARFSRDRDMEAVARIAMPVALACFLGAALSVVADQGRPWLAMRNLALYAQPSSALFTTFVTVGGVCLYGSLVHCVLARRPDLAEYAKRPSPWQGLQRILAAGYCGTPGQRYRRRKASFWMSLFMLLALLAPLVALAAIFTARPGRPPLVLGLEMLSFVILAATSGLGLLLGAAALVGRLGGVNAGLHPRGFARLGRILLLLVSLSVLVVILAEVVALKSLEPATSSYARALRAGVYAWPFWGAVVLMILAAMILWGAAQWQLLRPREVVTASALVLVAIFVQRYVLLVAWQTHGLSLPYRPGHYCPTWIELAVQLGIVALCVLLLLPSVRLIPFAPLTFDDEPAARPPRDARRTLLAGLWMCFASATTLVGFVFSGRAFTEPFLDPVVPASPFLFAIGLALLASAGVVYELVPERRAK